MTFEIEFTPCIKLLSSKAKKDLLDFIKINDCSKFHINADEYCDEACLHYDDEAIRIMISICGDGVYQLFCKNKNKEKKQNNCFHI